MIPTQTQLTEWRESASNTTFTSAMGEYTPDEFTTLLDSLEDCLMVLKGVRDCGSLLNLPPSVVREVRRVVGEWEGTEGGE